MAAEGLADSSWSAIYDRLVKVPNLPPNVLPLAQKHRRSFMRFLAGNEHQSRVQIMAELRQAAANPNDRAELSWTVLAEMFNDLSFVQSERAITSEYQWLGYTPEQTAPTVKKLAPLVAGHRFGKFLRTYADDRPAMIAGLTELVNSTKSTDFELQCAPIATASYQANSEFYRRLCDHMDNHWDKTDDDLDNAINTGFPAWQQSALDEMADVCPLHPVAVARAIHKSPGFTDEKAQEWEQQYADSRYLMLELGRKYHALGRSPDAIRCWKKSIDVSPSFDAYFELSDEYERMEEIEASKAVLEEALKLPSFGLESSNTHGKIAGLLMYYGRWEEAEPHARAAAASYSGHGLKTAARCAEGLKQWNLAEEFYQAMSERYESSSGDNWYFACVRVGRGNLASSRALAEKYWKTFVPPLRADQTWSLGLREIIDGNPKKAIEIFTNPQSIHHHDPHQFLVAAILADRLGDTAKRDALFGEIETRFGTSYGQVQLVNLFRNALRDPKQFHWNQYSFHEFTDELDFNDVCFSYYCAGEFLATHGRNDLSADYLDCAATTYDVHRNTCVLANLALRKRKIEVGDSRVNRQPDDRIPSLTYLWRSDRARKDKKYDEARADLAEALRIRPDFTAGLLSRAKLNEVEERYADAAEDYEAVLRINPDSEYAHFYLGALRSACATDELRDAAKALEHAQRCFDLSITKGAKEYWVMAAANAEAGNFAKAVEFQEQAIKRAPQQEEWPKQLALYRAGKPYRWPAPQASPSPPKTSEPEKKG